MLIIVWTVSLVFEISIRNSVGWLVVSSAFFVSLYLDFFCPLVFAIQLMMTPLLVFHSGMHEQQVFKNMLYPPTISSGLSLFLSLSHQWYSIVDSNVICSTENLSCYRTFVLHSIAVTRLLLWHSIIVHTRPILNCRWAPEVYLAGTSTSAIRIELAAHFLVKRMCLVAGPRKYNAST